MKSLKCCKIKNIRTIVFLICFVFRAMMINSNLNDTTTNWNPNVEIPHNKNWIYVNIWQTKCASMNKIQCANGFEGNVCAVHMNQMLFWIKIQIVYTQYIIVFKQTTDNNFTRLVSRMNLECTQRFRYLFFF